GLGQDHADDAKLSPVSSRPTRTEAKRFPRPTPDVVPLEAWIAEKPLGAAPRGAVLSRRPWHLPGSTRPKPPTTATPCTRLPKGLPYNSRLRSEEHTSELQSLAYLVCRLLLEKKNKSHIVSPTVSNKI